MPDDGGGRGGLFHFILPQRELQNTPSYRCGIKPREEAEARALGCELINDAAALLRLPQVCVARAQVLLHRLYFRVSLTECDVAAAALAAVFLASKLEECFRKLRKVLVVFHRVCLRRRCAAAAAGGAAVPLPERELRFECHSVAFARVREEVVRLERTMLRELGFLLHVEHPHKFVLFICRMLTRREQERELAQAAWAHINDSLRTTLCCRFPASVIACAAVWLAARRRALPLPCSHPDAQQHWWALFDCSTEDLVESVKAIAEVYTLPKPQYKQYCADGEHALPREFSLLPSDAPAESVPALGIDCLQTAAALQCPQPAGSGPAAPAAACRDRLVQAAQRHRRELAAAAAAAAAGAAAGACAAARCAAAAAAHLQCQAPAPAAAATPGARQRVTKRPRSSSSSSRGRVESSDRPRQRRRRRRSLPRREGPQQPQKRRREGSRKRRRRDCSVEGRAHRRRRRHVSAAPASAEAPPRSSNRSDRSDRSGTASTGSPPASAHPLQQPCSAPAAAQGTAATACGHAASSNGAPPRDKNERDCLLPATAAPPAAAPGARGRLETLEECSARLQRELRRLLSQKQRQQQRGAPV
eukprot:TRINITY_DN3812_c0_g2_i1.p1 TRINITY_DN3812_c0_g2~~TRINITY_DN3812_c0_g2_i1.p1  ORF type:complete len:590 (+),score=113.70 TRINITY_DN3812_c0_g2_i1:107-1876(+)